MESRGIPEADESDSPAYKTVLMFAFRMIAAATFSCVRSCGISSSGGTSMRQFLWRVRYLALHLFSEWEVLMLVDSEAAAQVSGAAETVDYFG